MSSEPAQSAVTTTQSRQPPPHLAAGGTRAERCSGSGRAGCRTSSDSQLPAGSLRLVELGPSATVTGETRDGVARALEDAGLEVTGWSRLPGETTEPEARERGARIAQPPRPSRVRRYPVGGGRALEVLGVSAGERSTESGMQHLSLLPRMCLLRFRPGVREKLADEFRAWVVSQRL
jgi:hypothetical protein